MKKRILLFTAVAGLAYVALSSYSSGAAFNNQIRNGVNGSTTTCGGAGCHATGGTTTNDSLRIDSAGGVAVSRYVAGMTYTVTVTGWTTGTQTSFGFQYSAVKGTSPGQTQAGTFAGLPSGVAKRTKSSIDYIEQNGTIIAGASSFTKSFTWTAPAAGTGDVKMYLTVNAVNGDGNEGAGDISKNYQKTITELVTPNNSVAEIANAINVLAYPNPMSDMLNVQFNDMRSGTYTLSLYDMTGRVLSTKQVEVSGASRTATINTAGLAKGLYNAVVEGNGNRKVMSVVK